MQVQEIIPRSMQAQINELIRLKPVVAECEATSRKCVVGGAGIDSQLQVEQQLQARLNAIDQNLDTIGADITTSFKELKHSLSRLGAASHDVEAQGSLEDQANDGGAHSKRNRAQRQPDAAGARAAGSSGYSFSGFFPNTDE